MTLSLSGLHRQRMNNGRCIYIEWNSPPHIVPSAESVKLKKALRGESKSTFLIVLLLIL